MPSSINPSSQSGKLSSLQDKLSAIQRNMQKISELTQNMAIVGTAGPGNQRYENLMDALDGHIESSDQIISQMKKIIGLP